MLKNIFIIFILVSTGFIRIESFEGIIEIDSVSASGIIIVDCNGQGNYTKIQSAIDNTSAGVTINVWSGIYYENVVINKSISLIGNGSDNSIIKGNGMANTIHISADWVNISGFQIKNSNSNYAGIKIEFANNVTISNNSCSSNLYGIWLYHSNHIDINNNSCNNNGFSGIRVYYSKFSILNNNSCFNNIHGIEFFGHNYFNNIKSNICINNDEGIVIESSLFSTINHNICNLNENSGIIIWYSKLCRIENNVCKNNKFGLNLWSLNFTMIKNNMCEQNKYGLYLRYCSYYNYLFNNSNNHNIYGLIIDNRCKNNMIINNSNNNNSKNGISCYRNSFQNIIAFNNCSHNLVGQSYSKSNNNSICYNNLFNNSNNGIFLDSYSNHNNLFNNFIISNNLQAIDNGTNIWNNNILHGNYWSDYNGQDNGENGRKINDGIGDTNLPHLGLDYYPLMKKERRNYTPFPPILKMPLINNLHGNYIISWFNSILANSFVLEEDTNIDFNTPKIIYNGSNLEYKILNKKNGTYFYRAKSINDMGISNWSNIIEIIINWPPEVPKNFTITVYPYGNILNLSWDLNINDIKEYVIEYKNESMFDWQKFVPISHPEFTFNHTGLVDGERYYYRIQARDHRGQLSNFSEIIPGIPQDSIPPSQPKGVKVISTTNDSINLVWNPNVEDDLEGYHIFRSKKQNPISWGEPLGKIPKGTEEYIDTGLDEETTYYYVLTAFDEVPNNSSYSNMIYETTILGPHKPLINNSFKNFSIPEDTVDDSTIKLYEWFIDINKDSLQFKCKGQKHLNVTIHQQNGSATLIPEKNWNGQETLTFYANDSVFEISDSITITITPVNDPPEPAVIISPREGFLLLNDTIINFSGICDDVDIIYGDKLTYTWSSNITGTIGNGENLTDILLPPGYHQITFEVVDIVGETTKDIVNISIFENKTIKPSLVKYSEFGIDLKLVPNSIVLKPGELATIKAIVTNVGTIQDEIILTYDTQIETKLEVVIIGDQIKIVESNKTADFAINIKIPEKIAERNIIVIFTAASIIARDYNMEVKRDQTLTIDIIEDEKPYKDKDGTINLLWMMSLIITIIIILNISLLKKKKETVDSGLKQGFKISEAEKQQSLIQESNSYNDPNLEE
jgi:parallel beta-helix repeat protein